MNCKHTLNVMVMETKQHSLLSLKGCVDLNLITVNDSVHMVADEPLEHRLAECDSVFQGNGCLPGEYDLEIDESVTPVRPRKIDLSMNVEVKTKLDTLTKQRIIEQVESPTPWINHLQLVRKSNGAVRLCLDPENLNQALKRNHCQMPDIDDVLPQLAEAKMFSLCDAKDGFLQARECGLKLNKKKYRFPMTELPYIGHILTSEGVKPHPKKMCAIRNMEAPRNSEEVKHFFGHVNYMAKFMPNLSAESEPLRRLLNLPDKEFCWGVDQRTAYETLKQVLTSETRLQYYDSRKPIVIQTNASTTGLGAVLLQEDKLVAREHVFQLQKHESQCQQFETIDPVRDCPVTGALYVMILKETEREKLLQQLSEVIKNGWPWWTFRDELAFLDGPRVVIPTSMHRDILKVCMQATKG